MPLAFLLSRLVPVAIVQAAASATTQPSRPPAADPAEQRLHTDWAWIGRYRDANAALGPASANAPRVVFMGDSITQGWIDKVPTFFTAGRIDRGIGGQTTPQMLVRFRQDVIDLHPAVVHIMAGTNDIAGNTGPMSEADTQANIRSMVELAQANGIRVILASIPPADRYPWRPGLDTGRSIARLNAWLRSYAAERGAVYADYWSALRDPAQGDGLGMRAGLSSDHVHPTEAGYAVMAPVADRAIEAALSQPATPAR